MPAAVSAGAEPLLASTGGPGGHPAGPAAAGDEGWNAPTAGGAELCRPDAGSDPVAMGGSGTEMAGGGTGAGGIIGGAVDASASGLPGG